MNLDGARNLAETALERNRFLSVGLRIFLCKYLFLKLIWRIRMFFLCYYWSCFTSLGVQQNLFWPFLFISVYFFCIREMVATSGHIQNKQHSCTECVESKERHKVDWINAYIAGKKKKQCFSCGKWKSIDSYPKDTQASIAQARKNSNRAHSRSKYIEKNA